MTEKTTNNKVDSSSSDYKKLSIQASLNGLSFCVMDTIDNSLLLSKSVVFEKERNPYELQKELKTFLEKQNIHNANFSEVVVIHKNNLFSLVPKSLFNENELANYLKFNAKILESDHFAHDEIEPYDIVNVYVPFVNINNYIYELFGEFEFKHNATVLIQTLLNNHSNGKDPMCYVHVSKQQMEVTIISQKKLVFYNSFVYHSKEDFIYYLLFTLEQLKLDTETTLLRMFGSIDEGDDLHSLCHHYIKNVSIYVPENIPYLTTEVDKETIDFTVLNAL
ncbi:hypothetical protein GGR42_000898 [Saonia flava]|uniref:DUF3822 domain-containing protein n=1 Tax=Saonia flava TaxID=523696 RepID=A0A846QN32_9FLAO|nr:DUF3822 family protein [Saonia flava]NJB70436.1 hypothetical protein [Saonia flava]